MLMPSQKIPKREISKSQLMAIKAKNKLLKIIDQNYIG
jgi:hypothetical protein